LELRQINPQALFQHQGRNANPQVLTCGKLKDSLVGKTLDLYHLATWSVGDNRSHRINRISLD
jgi:hypothetical protein